MATVYGFNQEKDIDRVLRMLDSFERSKGKSVISPSSVRKEARYAKIVELIDESEDDNAGKEAKGIEVVWNPDNFSFSPVSDGDNPVKYDNDILTGSGATVFSTNNISSQSKMAVDDIVLLQRYPHLSETSGWLVVETAGESSTRAFVIITEVTNASTYLGNVLGGPNDADVIEQDVQIRVFDATTNAFAVGYRSFADLSGGFYYLEGTLLG